MPTMATSNSVTTTRRDFLKAGAGAVGAAVAGARVSGDDQSTASRPTRFAAPPIPVVRIGFVGIGGMGSVHVQNLLRLPGVRLTAVCDIAEDRTRWAQKKAEEAGQPQPTAYTRGPRDFVRLCGEEDLDLVFTATPWEWHVPICLEAMRHGKHAATEVPASYTLDDCWALVDHAEKYQKHCVMMENCNYDRMELMVLHMARKGVLGEILHGECGYLHDLRGVKFSDKGEGLWRRAHAMKRNGNLYPTHGLGPIAQCMNINRGDRFEYLVSMSGPSRGLQEYAQEHFPPDAPQRRERFVLGDVNVSLIHTQGGRTIYVSHDTNLPRPYSRIHLVQGTRGLFQGYPSRVYIEGRSQEHRWDEATNWQAEFEHPLWTAARRVGDQRRSRRDGLHRGLPSDSVSAAGPADRHGCV